MNDALRQRLKSVYGADGDREKLDSTYDDWAKTYDQDLWASGNPHLALMVGMACRYVSEPAGRHLDAGCGTGMLGQLLHPLGFTNIEGLDASEGMLDAARAKGVYTALHHLLLGERIDLPDGSYDAITASGVLTHGHAPPESLDGLLKLAKPGAPILFSISEVAHDEGGFGQKIEEIEQTGAWDKLAWSGRFQSYPFLPEQAHLRHWICAYRKAG